MLDLLTHFKEGVYPYLQNRYFPNVYHASNQEAKTKGVAILILNRIPWPLTDKCLDPEGRYIFLKGSIGSEKVTLATIYAPNVHQEMHLAETI